MGERTPDLPSVQLSRPGKENGHAKTRLPSTDGLVGWSVHPLDHNQPVHLVNGWNLIGGGD